MQRVVIVRHHPHPLPASRRLPYLPQVVTSMGTGFNYFLDTDYADLHRLAVTHITQNIYFNSHVGTPPAQQLKLTSHHCCPIHLHLTPPAHDALQPPSISRPRSAPAPAWPPVHRKGA